MLIWCYYVEIINNGINKIGKKFGVFEYFYFVGDCEGFQKQKNIEEKDVGYEIFRMIFYFIQEFVVFCIVV